MKTAIGLSEYVAGFPNGLGAKDAVALLMPAAVQLRNIHSTGNGHFKVAPENIEVCNGKAILAPASVAAQPEAAYVSPEGNSAITADIYSFSAVLAFAASGKEFDGEVNCEDSDFAEILAKGTAADAAERFSSMEELIAALSPYNCSAESAVNSEPTIVSPAAPATKRKKKFPVIAIIAIALTVLILGAGATYYFTYSEALQRATYADFMGAEKMLIIPKLTEKHDPELLDYIEAGKLKVSQKYAPAAKAFEALSGYLDADEHALNSKYLLANQALDNGELDTALSLYLELAEKGYKDTDERILQAKYSLAGRAFDSGDLDSALLLYSELAEAGYTDAETKVLDTRFEIGNRLLHQDGDFSAASDIFAELDKAGYPDADDMYEQAQFEWALSDMMDGYYLSAYDRFSGIPGYPGIEPYIADLEGMIYDEAVNAYHDGDYSVAKNYFETLSSYWNEDDYLTLIRAHNLIGSNPAYALVEDLIDIFDFEDASELLLSNQALGEAFLEGHWEGDGYYFTMENGGHISYDLPWFEFGDVYEIEDGAIVLYEEDDESQYMVLFSMVAYSPDCVEFYCYEDYSAHLLYRK